MTTSPSEDAEPQPPTEIPDGVPDDADIDLPPEGGNVSLVSEKDPEGDHRRGMDKQKLTFAITIVSSCLGVVVLLSVAQYVFQEQLKEAGQLDGAIDWLKIIATTALGFIFGRTLDKKE